MINFISQHINAIAGGLFILVLALIFIIVAQWNILNKDRKKDKNGNSEEEQDCKQKLWELNEKYKTLESNYKELQKEKLKLFAEKNQLEEKYRKLCVDFGNAKRDKDELQHLQDSQADNSGKENSDSSTKEKSDETKEKTSVKTPATAPQKKVVRYAPCPLSNGEKTCFTDLTAEKDDESLFVLEITGDIAYFKPIDFKSIRNFDDAMAVVDTEGAKPNVATKAKIKSLGNAYKEGTVWVVKDFTKLILE